MGWLLPALVAQTIAAFALIGVFAWLYRQYREKYLAVWTLSWIAYGVRFAVAMAMLLWKSHPLLIIINQGAGFLSGVLLVMGMMCLLGRTPSRRWLVVAVGGLVWIVAAVALKLPFLALTGPTFAFLTGAYIWVGLSVLRSPLRRSSTSIFAAVIFVLWGLHKANYPLLRSVEWLAPWGFMLGALFAISLAMALLLTYFDMVRGKLEASERQLRTVFEAARNVSFILTDAGRPIPRVVEFSPGAEAIFGYARSEMIGRGVDILHPQGDPEHFAEAHQALDQGEGEFGKEITLVRKNGERFPAMFSLFPVRDESGAVVSALGVSIDISERKSLELSLQEREERFRTLVENIPGAVYRCGTRKPWRMEHISESVKDMLGVPAEAFMAQQVAWGDIVHPGDVGTLKSLMDQAIASGDPFVAQYRVKHTDGTVRWVFERGRASYDADGEAKWLDGVILDITEQKLLEERLHHSQRMESMGTLAGGIAHDFNNILAAILGFGELALSELDPASEPAECVEEILSATHRATRLVRQILTFSRAGHGETVAFAVCDVAEEALQLITATLPTTISVRSSIDRDAGVVFGDPTKIHQVVMNLATNARHALGERGELELGVQRVQTPETSQVPWLPTSECVQLMVRDTGIGMAPHVLERIFDPFFTTKQPGQGSGMGLSVVHGIVVSHGGRVEVESVPGEGTTFRVYLPLHTGDASRVTGRSQRPQRGTGHILLVDDEPLLAKAGQRALERMGYKVTTAGGGEEALRTFQAAPTVFDALITDQTMPCMTGLALTSAVLAQRPGLPVIICTGYSDSLDEHAARRAGAGAFLMKPVQNELMAETLAKLLAAPR